MTTSTPNTDPHRYDHAAIEKKWQSRWAADRLYEARDDDPREPYYLLTMFPYPSGDLHIGHWFAMVPPDVAARYQRMLGKNVLFPMGFDAFGLPAENAAIREGARPHAWTYANIERMRGQLHTMGSSFDWSREIITADPEYYRWTQWFFVQLLKHDLAYRAMAPANWCPSCQTVLANEQVVRGEDGLGRCERCETVVETRDLEQWFFRITKYAEELLDFSSIEWPERIRTMQTNWIGRSEGAEIRFKLEAAVAEWDAITVFTTRADTVFGATYMVLAPEHPLVALVTTDDQRGDVDAYVHSTRMATEIERQSTERPKTGVATGAYALHPFTGARIPIWIADYVLASYGHGAVMGVPAHDTRDFAFATQYGFEIPVVVGGPAWDGEPLSEAYTGDGRLVNSGEFEGLSVAEGKAAIAAALAEREAGGVSINYRIRDWLISRQRYWGAPIPVIYCPSCGPLPVPEDQLPVLLPEVAEFLPTGESPLALNAEFVNVPCPQCGEPAKRETDTLDTFMCSSWYFFRYPDPHNNEAPISGGLAKQWLPVDQYTGGAEHAVMHLLYVRFFTKACRDMGIVPLDEPFLRLFNQGTMTKDGAKMSKSRGNVVNPDDWVSKLGADAVRLYLMFLGPWDRGGDWDDSSIQGHYRWLNRIWALARLQQARGSDAESATRIRRLTHRMIAKASEDIASFRFNTMLAAMMEFTNALAKEPERGAVDGEAWDEAMRSLVLCLAPSAPHFAEELWERLGNAYSVHQQPWPEFDPALISAETVTLVVQVNGKVRAQLETMVGLDAASAQAVAEADASVQRHLEGKTLRKVVHVPDRLVNFVVG
ncbi:MAG: leucyl-tRNA synthetase [Chloroflexi bacterium]|nr:MAG: leucyl-tRNA synthetase [Chloroflexota bacterium]